MASTSTGISSGSDTDLIVIRLEGIDELEQRLRAMPDKIVRSVFRKALRSTANKTKRRLKRGTPKRTGEAGRSIKVKVRIGNSVAWARVQYKGKPAFYMRLYELGAVNSGRQPARPFFNRAIGDWRKQAEDDLAKALERAVSKAAA